MNNLFWMLTVTDRQKAETFTEFYKKYGIEISLVTVGRGTAAGEVLDFLGLDITEKAVLFAVVTGKVWKAVQYGLRNRMRIDVPGTGIAFIIPLSSIGGKKQLAFLTQGQEFEKGEESVLKDTRHELLAVISNQGYNDLIMDAARSAGAGGGTVIHARGTGMNRAEHFLGVSLAREKELTLIVVKTAMRNEVMRAVMDKAGLETKAKAIVFSLPVTDTAGMRLIEDEFTEEMP